MPDRIPRAAYADMFGPTTGDKISLADTDLVIEVEKDFTTTGEAFGSGKFTRGGIAQRQVSRAVDTVILNALIIDHWGIVKADVGIKDGKIAGIGKAGNPEVEPGIDIIVGPATAAIAGEGKILTAGALDMHIHAIAPRRIGEALAAGVTTMLGGADPATGPAATPARGPDPGPIGRMVAAAEGLPINLAFAGRGNASLPATLEAQVIAGAAALQLDRDWGTTAAAIDDFLTVADALDVQVMIDTNTLSRSGVEGAIAALKDRTIRADHAEGAPGDHPPDIIKVCGLSNILPSTTDPTRPGAVGTIDGHFDRLMVRHNLDPSIAEDVLFAESRIGKAATVAEDFLHDIGAFSMVATASQTLGQAGAVVIRAFQTAHKMKVRRGRLPNEDGDNDNFRVKRYIAKMTINPAITHGIDEWVGSIEIGKLADLVLWSPAFFGVKPDLVIKLGTIAAAPIGGAGPLTPTLPPIDDRLMLATEAATRSAVTFVSRAALDDGLAAKLGLDRPLYPVHNTRAGISKESMIHNAATPKIEIDAETGAVHADGELLSSSPAELPPMAGSYFLF